MSSTIWALTDATSAVGTQRIPVATAEAAGSNAYITPAYLRAYVAANMTPITLTGGTVTSSTPVLDASQTWNSGGTTFTGLKLNVTDTASASASLLMDLQVGGSSKYSVSKAGVISLLNSVTQTIYNDGTNLTLTNGNGAANSGFQYFATNDSGLIWVIRSNGPAGTNRFSVGGGNSSVVSIGSGQTFAWTSSANASGTADTILARDAANTLALRNSTSAQTFRAYNTYTNSSNGEWGTFDWSSSSNVLTIGTNKNGTGSARSARFIIGGVEAFAVGTDLSLTVSASGYFTSPVITDTVASSFRGDSSGLAVASGKTYRFSSTSNPNGSADIILARDAAGVMGLRGTSTTSPAAQSFYTYGASPPSAPGASIVRLYADTSGGKIRLMAIFPSGAAQQIAIEP